MSDTVGITKEVTMEVTVYRVEVNGEEVTDYKVVCDGDGDLIIEIDHDSIPAKEFEELEEERDELLGKIDELEGELSKYD